MKTRVGSGTVEFAAGLVLFSYDKASVLLVKDRKGAWRFPSGRVEEGESFLEAALRELEEETGLWLSDEFVHPLPLWLVGGVGDKEKVTALFPAVMAVSVEGCTAPLVEDVAWLPIALASQTTAHSGRRAVIELATRLVGMAAPPRELATFCWSLTNTARRRYEKRSNATHQSTTDPSASL